MDDVQVRALSLRVSMGSGRAGGTDSTIEYVSTVSGITCELGSLGETIIRNLGQWAGSAKPGDSFRVTLEVLPPPRGRRGE